METGCRPFRRLGRARRRRRAATRSHVHPLRHRRRAACRRDTAMNLPDPVTAAEDGRALAELNVWLATQTAEARVAWALDALPGEFALSSSFGAQSAVSLHMVTRQAPMIPVVLVDTGYL